MSSMLIVSTVGTSVLYHGASDSTRSWLTQVANERDIPIARVEDWNLRVAECRSKVVVADIEQQRRMSAELNGIHALLEEAQRTRVHHILVCTDTALGKAAGEIVMDTLRSASPSNAQVELFIATNLRTADVDEFRMALGDLTGYIEQRIASDRSGFDEIVFNLTGGFKSVNAYLQVIGMLHADRCVFLFERSSALLEIPRLPLELNAESVIREHLRVFRRLAVKMPVSPLDRTSIPESMLLILGDSIDLNSSGLAYWNLARSKVFREAIQEPLSDRLTISRQVFRAFESLGSDDKIETNQALDAFAAHIEEGTPLLASRKTEQLQVQRPSGATHELRVSSSGAAYRLYYHVDGDRYVFDELDKHL